MSSCTSAVCDAHRPTYLGVHLAILYQLRWHVGDSTAVLLADLGAVRLRQHLAQPKVRHLQEGAQAATFCFLSSSGLVGLVLFVLLIWRVGLICSG
jgi:hypothetical protein